MIALFTGAFIFLFGSMMLANAAFSDRAQLGFVIAFVGLLIFCGGAVELAIQLFAP